MNNDDLLTMNRAQLREEVIKLREKPNYDELLSNAWGIIANVGNGDWKTQTAEWQEAAAKYRDSIFPVAPKATTQEPLMAKVELLTIEKGVITEIDLDQNVALEE